MSLVARYLAGRAPPRMFFPVSPYWNAPVALGYLLNVPVLPEQWHRIRAFADLLQLK